MKKAQHGFTLIEVSLALLVSVSILGGVGYLYSNAQIENLGVITANETLSATALCLAQESGVNTGCSPLVESGGEAVTAITTPLPTAVNTVPVFAISYGGPLARSLSGNSTGGIPQNACYVAYAAINDAGYVVISSGSTAANLTTALSSITGGNATTAESAGAACPSGTTYGLIISQRALN